ncbi:MAG: hypothetical protein AMXMBFR8_17460 [Nevskiales bacterium]
MLLPLSDAERKVAEAVRDGFVAAHLAAGARADRPELLILDASGPGATAAYQTAVAAKAGVIVGPLLKQAVAEVAAAGTPVPTLALNFLDPDTATPSNLYQFSLSPEDEARQVAERATTQGQRRALALAPDNDWGRRMLAAFIPALESREGRVIDYHLYDPSATDYTAAIERLLLLDESRARYRQLTAYLGVPVGFEARRRDDVDLIFLAANVGSGRLIWPQLRFLYAGDLPTYATSSVFQAGSSGDRDLDGVMFTDIPALLDVQPEAAELRAAIAAHWPPGTTALMRFFAMGFDAYALARDLGDGVQPRRNGLTGQLSTDPQRRIHREMPWAKFRDGAIVVLPAVAPQLPPSAPSPAPP